MISGSGSKIFCPAADDPTTTQGLPTHPFFAREAANAREKLNRLLTEYSLTWNDLPGILAAADTGSSTSTRASQAAPTDQPEVNVA
jgi:hypothetical protein